jgi:transcriptional regulator with PAS, ATPase and Fis domain
MKSPWIKEFSAAVTVCDKNGIILEMNNKSASTFAKDGGFELIGKNLYDCHPATAAKKIEELITEKKINIYTIEKNGVKKLVYQAPFWENSELKGLVEIVLEIPFEMPHFIRQ